MHKYRYQDEKNNDALRVSLVCPFPHFSNTPVFVCYVYTMRKNNSKCIKVQKIVNYEIVNINCKTLNTMTVIIVFTISKIIFHFNK